MLRDFQPVYTTPPPLNESVKRKSEILLDGLQQRCRRLVSPRDERRVNQYFRDRLDREFVGRIGTLPS
jgi:hypothetical protein